MSERLEDNFKPEIEVFTHDGVVVAVLYDGRMLAFDADEETTAGAAGYRELYETVGGFEVLAVEISDDES